MSLRITCPACSAKIPLTSPLPLPGTAMSCGECHGHLAVTYPAGVMERLRASGVQFAGEDSPTLRPPTTAPTKTETIPQFPNNEEFATTVIDDEAPKKGKPTGRTNQPVELAVPSAKPAPYRAGSRWIRRVIIGSVAIAMMSALILGASFYYYSKGLPSTEALEMYDPPTVTVVLDRHGETLGEIYTERRYVVPLDVVPAHTINAFLAAEDANFYSHGGVDFIGLVRAMLKNIQAGRMAQGASTITQQVTRSFLLTREKKIARKIREMILSWRIEKIYTKDRILYLYLNEVYLGSGAYGVEAASRVYFDKNVQELTIAESAMLAGLPQRPSDYSPHRHFDKAQVRQQYVLGQMLAKDFITQEESDTAHGDYIDIAPKSNAFLTKSPHFTETARRHVVEKYGHEKVYNEGLIIHTTCDLALQTVAQNAVTARIDEIDQRMGFRRPALSKRTTSIEEWRAASTKKIVSRWKKKQDPAGRIPPPTTAPLMVGERYEALVLSVTSKYATVAIGETTATVPLAWSKWLYPPNPRKSWRYRYTDDLTMKVDLDANGTGDGPILVKDDLVWVDIVTLDAAKESHGSAFSKLPSAQQNGVAAKIWQVPEVEGALLSMDSATGAVRAMVGGADFSRSELNRTRQSRRQVGSTFKPIVYAAAISSKKVTAATMIADAPLAFAGGGNYVWKPGNYSNEYLGNITLRQALSKSKNTCTVRLLEAIDPGMDDDVIYNFGRALGIGGPPTHTLKEGHIPTPKNDHLCPWIKEREGFPECRDRYPAKDPVLSNAAHQKQLTPEDNYQCRACDRSMSLGSASLTMEELVRAYSTFGTGGLLVQPYYIDKVTDRTGSTIFEEHAVVEHEQVMEPEVATIVNWLLQNVVKGGTGFAATSLGLNAIGGKTGTTNKEKDAWFIGLTPDVITAVWVGFDQPRPLGVSSTGGTTALPIFVDYMRKAAPKKNDRPFPKWGDVVWAQIDEEHGRRVSEGGRSYPFIKGTAPIDLGIEAGQIDLDEATTEL
jgi:penicillin-binding protein 1A